MCRPAPRDTWHGAGGELRAGRRDRRRLTGPRHGRAAGQRRSGLPAPPGHRRRSPQGLRGAVPVSGFCRRRKEGCREGAAPGSPRLGAAGVNAPGRTGPGQREGEERPPAGTAAPPPHSALLSGKGGALAPAALGEGRPAQGSLPAPAPRRGSSLRGRVRSPPGPRVPLACGESARSTRVFNAFSATSRLSGSGGWRPRPARGARGAGGSPGPLRAWPGPLPTAQPEPGFQAVFPRVLRLPWCLNSALPRWGYF